MELPKRKPLRLREFDYSTVGAYFITICTQNRRCMLPHIVGAIHESPEAQLPEYGKIVDKVINDVPGRFGVMVQEYVIMPNHIHLIIIITDDADLRAIHESPLHGRSIISKIVGYIKMNASKAVHDRDDSVAVWQRGYYDHVIRNRADYEQHLKYIYENPLRWYYDELYSEE